MKLPSNRFSSIITGFCILAFSAISAQANMKEAIEHLKKARKAAENATADKGGHRVKAIAAIDAAIAQVQAGIDFDKANVSGQEAAKKAERKANKKN